jgi:hypothetical protein
MTEKGATLAMLSMVEMGWYRRGPLERISENCLAAPAPPLLSPPPRDSRQISLSPPQIAPFFTSVLSMSLGIRQGAAVLEIGDLEAAASLVRFAEGLTTTGWAPRYIVPISFSIPSEHRRLF